MWIQSALPQGFAKKMRELEPPLAETYEQSGWCFVESSLSSVLKPRELRLDVGARDASG